MGILESTTSIFLETYSEVKGQAAMTRTRTNNLGQERRVAKFEDVGIGEIAA